MPFESSTQHQYEFSISGDAQFEDDSDFTSVFKKEKRENEKTIHWLNTRQHEIADNISRAIERQLPAEFRGDVKIETTIEFSSGSLAWVGIVTALDWVGKIVDVVTFVQLMSSAIQFAVNKVISKEASENSISIRFETIYTNARPNFTPISQTDLLYRDVLMRQEEQLRMIRDLWRSLNTLVTYIGQLRDRNMAFRLSSYPNRSARLTQQTRWLSKDMLLLLSLVVILFILSVDYFKLDAIRAWIANLIAISP